MTNCFNHGQARMNTDFFGGSSNHHTPNTEHRTSNTEHQKMSRLRASDSAPWTGPLVESKWGEMTAMTPALSPLSTALTPAPLPSDG